MTDMNRVTLIGRLGRDPEVRSFQNGDKVCNVAIATGERWKDKTTGEQKEKTEWHQVAIFGPLAGIAEQYLRKASRVYLEGQMRTRKWQDQSGADRYSTEVVLQGFDAKLIMLDRKEDGAGEGRSDAGGGQGAGYGAGGGGSYGGAGAGGGQGAGYGGSAGGGGTGAGGGTSSYKNAGGGGYGAGGRPDLDDEIPFAPEVR